MHRPDTKGTILLIDDHPGSRTSLAQMLRDEGYKVHTTETHEKAKEWYQEHKGNIALIITDNHHAYGDNAGIDFIRWVREQESVSFQKERKRLPIILCSGYSPLEQISLNRRMECAGGDALLPKPPNTDDLLAIIDMQIANSTLETPHRWV